MNALGISGHKEYLRILHSKPKMPVNVLDIHMSPSTIQPISLSAQFSKSEVKIINYFSKEADGTVESLQRKYTLERPLNLNRLVQLICVSGNVKALLKLITSNNRQQRSEI